MGDDGWKSFALPAMSEEQLTALLAKIKEDAGLQEKFKGVADLDAAVALAKEVGFDINKADWLKYQAKQTIELSDEELEGMAGGICYTVTGAGIFTGGFLAGCRASDACPNTISHSTCR